MKTTLISLIAFLLLGPGSAKANLKFCESLVSKMGRYFSSRPSPQTTGSSQNWILPVGYTVDVPAALMQASQVYDPNVDVVFIKTGYLSRGPDIRGLLGITVPGYEPGYVGSKLWRIGNRSVEHQALLRFLRNEARPFDAVFLALSNEIKDQHSRWVRRGFEELNDEGIRIEEEPTARFSRTRTTSRPLMRETTGYRKFLKSSVYISHLLLALQIRIAGKGLDPEDQAGRMDLENWLNAAFRIDDVTEPQGSRSRIYKVLQAIAATVFLVDSRPNLPIAPLSFARFLDLAESALSKEHNPFFNDDGHYRIPLLDEHRAMTEALTKLGRLLTDRAESERLISEDLLKRAQNVFNNVYINPQVVTSGMVDGVEVTLYRQPDGTYGTTPGKYSRRENVPAPGY